MSDIYLLEPHTSGKVILHTTDGDIAIELWPKEAPKACRNFVQLCMEGYYNNTIFHRIVANFIIQGGDPEGTGEGGESSFEGEKPFADEFHSRLRFVRRGLVAMANSGVPNDNRSQFFITLDATPELQNKHTIFGKIGGDTIFNVLKIGGLEVDSNERPLYPPKVTGCTIVVNPFDDIVPRISRQEQEAARLREQEAQKKPEKQKKQKKNVALLSFADDAPEEGDEIMDNDNGLKKKKMMSSHDLLDEDPTLSKQVDASLLVDLEENSSLSSKSKRRKSKVGQTKDEPSPKEPKHKLDDDLDDDNSKDEQQQSYNDFDQRMRDQVRAKRDALQKSKSSSSSSPSASNTPHESPSIAMGSTKSDTVSEGPTPQPPSSSTASSTPLTEREKTRQEIQKLEKDIRKMHNRDSDDDEEGISKKLKSDRKKVSLLQLEREQYKTRKELAGTLASTSQGKSEKRARQEKNAERDRDLMTKLMAFEQKVSTMAKEPEPNPTPKKNDAPPCEIHGVPSCESCQDSSKIKEGNSQGGVDNVENVEDSDDNDVGWMQHKLVFEKDLKGKEVSLSAKRDDIYDYVVIDPLNKAPAMNKAMEMEKARNLEKKKREQQGRSHNGSSGGGGGRNDRRDYREDRDTRYPRDRKDGRDGNRDERRPYDRSSTSSSSSSWRRDDNHRSSSYSDSRSSGSRGNYK